MIEPIKVPLAPAQYMAPPISIPSPNSPLALPPTNTTFSIVTLGEVI